MFKNLPFNYPEKLIIFIMLLLSFIGLLFYLIGVGIIMPTIAILLLVVAGALGAGGIVGGIWRRCDNIPTSPLLIPPANPTSRPVAPETPTLVPPLPQSLHEGDPARLASISREVGELKRRCEEDQAKRERQREEDQAERERQREEDQAELAQARINLERTCRGRLIALSARQAEESARQAEAKGLSKREPESKSHQKLWGN